MTSIMKTQQQGFTLIELIVTLVVLGVLIGMAIPGFRHISTSSTLTTSANQFVSALNTARIEAIKRAAPVQFCSEDTALNQTDTLGTACGTDSGAIYARTSAGTEAIQAGFSITDDKLQLASGTHIAAIRYDAMGLGSKAGETGPYTGTVADICSDDIDGDNHRVIKMTTGSILEVTTDTGDCP